jgi:hypothetical protein
MGVPGKTCHQCQAKKIKCDKFKGRGKKDAEEPVEEVDEESGKEPVVESKSKGKEPGMRMICIGRVCTHYPLVWSTGVIVLPARRPVASSSRIISKPVVLLSAPPAPEVPICSANPPPNPLFYPPSRLSSPDFELDVLVIEDDDDDETPKKRSKPSTPTGPSPEQVTSARRAVVSLEENILNMCVFLKGMEKRMSEAEGHVAKSEKTWLH